jgi:hypothetical protein
MNSMHSATFYVIQSPVTDPGPMAHLFADLPADIPTLRRIASHLVIHYRADDPAKHGIPDERIEEINTRYVEAMLRRIVELDDRPLIEERPLQLRLVGCCRDFTVLFLSMLRQKGIPARARVGFASYFVPGWNVDHEVAEVWDAVEQRWRLIDAELEDTHVDPADGVGIDALNVPRDRFLVAGEAWARCRAGEADPERFVVDPGLEIPVTRGWLQLRHNLVQDLAALNKAEMILWDTWGLLGDDPSTVEEGRLLDRVADLTRQHDPAMAELQSIYDREPGLRVPEVVTSFGPTSDQPTKVTIRP